MRKIVLLILSTGWIVTLIASLYLNYMFLENEVYPVVYGTTSQLNSFPYIHAAKTLLHISLVWFCFVLIGWSAYFLKQVRQPQ
jgi:hypothetical protein